MIPDECSSYFSCSALLCPLDKNYLSRVYLVDDPVCTSRIAMRGKAGKAIWGIIRKAGSR